MLSHRYYHQYFGVFLFNGTQIIQRRSCEVTLFLKIPTFPSTNTMLDNLKDSLCAKNKFDPFIRFDTTPTCDRQTQKISIYRIRSCTASRG